MDKQANGAARALDDLIADLHAQPRLRVWSLVISCLGDAFVPRGGRAGLAQIQSVMERLGLEAGAVRTAMSRLAADGWVTREREGRLSFYRLAEAGRHAFDEATKRIYASAPPQWDGIWSVLISPSTPDPAQSEKLYNAGFARAGTQAFVRAEISASLPLGDLGAGMLVFRGPGEHLPQDLSGLWELDDLAADYGDFIGKWTPMANLLGSAISLNPLDAMAARTLLIHDWRRLVLRDPGLPHQLLPGDWPGQAARQLARRIYAPLAPVSEAWLDEAGMPPHRDALAFAQRFGIQAAISADV